MHGPLFFGGGEQGDIRHISIFKCEKDIALHVVLEQGAVGGIYRSRKQAFFLLLQLGLQKMQEAKVGIFQQQAIQGNSFLFREFLTDALAV